MKKWILLLLLFNQFCLGGEPPFSDLQRKPSISPYLMLDENINLRFQEIRPYLEQQKFRGNQNFNQKPLQEHRKEFHYPSHGIRPTGHPTYFLYIPNYNFK